MLPGLGRALAVKEIEGIGQAISLGGENFY